MNRFASAVTCTNLMHESFCPNVEPLWLIDEAFCLDAGAGKITRSCPVGKPPLRGHASGHKLAEIACALREGCSDLPISFTASSAWFRPASSTPTIMRCSTSCSGDLTTDRNRPEADGQCEVLGVGARTRFTIALPLD